MAPPPLVDPTSLVEVAHDFGIIRHGQTASKDLVIEVPNNEGPGGDYIPLRYTRKCSCAREQFVIVDSAGDERFPTGQPISDFAVRDGERLEVRLEVNTDKKEAVDLDSVVILGNITMQTESPPHSRVDIPLHFKFGIHSPVLVAPAATVNLGKLPPSVEYSRKYYLSGNDDGPVRFSNAVCYEADPADPTTRRVANDARCTLQPQQDGRTLLRVTMQPAADREKGPFSMEVEVGTDLPDGYVLRMPMSGFVIDDIELGIPGQIQFGQIDLTKPDSQSIQVTDHRKDQPAGFFAVAITGHDGEDLSPHFEAKVVAIDGERRRKRIILRYLGTLTNRRFIRGTVDLAKEPDGAVLKNVEFVAFRRR